MENFYSLPEGPQDASNAMIALSQRTGWDSATVEEQFHELLGFDGEIELKTEGNNVVVTAKVDGTKVFGYLLEETATGLFVHDDVENISWAQGN
ncbi:hypothetical protein JKY72_03185 [Candidatus Gracilibacteria bacterium]|nr:hypothetical protein [Candidatus Gracilibacteria bacterium]